MSVKNVLIPLEEGLWQRMKARAAEEGRTTKDVVASAFRVYLTQGETTPEDPKLEREPAAPSAAGGEGAARVLAAMREAGMVTTGGDLLRRGRVTPENPREAAQRRAAAQDRLRSHPEDASQDPADDEEA